MNAENPLFSSGNSDSRQNKATYQEENIQDICNKNIKEVGGRKYSRYI